MSREPISIRKADENWGYQRTKTLGCTLWLFNIAMENGLSLHGLPIRNGDFPWLC